MLSQVLWKNLSHIDLLNIHPEMPPEIDIVISGGGFLGYYLVGVDRILKKLSRENKICIRRYAGTSVGALASVAMVCDIGDKMINLYDWLEGNVNYFYPIREYFLSILPEDAYIRCSDRVFISITIIEFWLKFIPTRKSYVVSQFESNEDLVDACMASSNIPFFISPHLFFRYRNLWCLDGWFIRNINYFTDHLRPQLVVNLLKIPYSWRTSFTPFQDVIIPLVVKGAVETERFLTHNSVHSRALEWRFPQPVFRKRSIILKLFRENFHYGFIGLFVGIYLGKNYFSFPFTRGAGTRRS